MHPSSAPATHRGTPGVFAQAPVCASIIDGNQRLLASYPFEGGGLLEIRVTGQIGTEDALQMVETLVELSQGDLDATQKGAKG